MKNNKGFSLVELIVVIAIMAILAAVAIPTFASFINKANVSTDVDFLNNAEYAAELAYAADPAKEVDYVVVELGADGAVAKVIVNFKGTNETAVEVEEEVAEGASEEVELIAGTIDWAYKFKSVKTGEWKLDGKALAAADAE